MSNPAHVDLLRSGVSQWNSERPSNWADLRGEDLSHLNLAGVDLIGVDLSDSNLRGSNLEGARCQGAFLSGCNLQEARLRGANLYYARFVKSNLALADLAGTKMVGATLDGATLVNASLSRANLMAAHLRGTRMEGANLSGANLTAASLINADLTRANLSEAVLAGASLVRTNIEGAVLDGALVYGIAAWDLQGEPKSSANLLISPSATVTVQDVRVAQLVYMMLSNANIRNIVDALTSKIVLLLGRFGSQQKLVLQSMAAELTRMGYAPVIFDFDGPTDRDTTETVGLLARLSRFIVADITAAKSVPQELYSIAPHVEVPILPLILDGDAPWSMFRDLLKFPWVLKPEPYASLNDLLHRLPDLVDSANLKRLDILRRRGGGTPPP